MVLRAIIVIVLIVLTAYGLKEAWPLLSGPELMITSPQNGGTFDDGFIKISGTAVHTQTVSFNSNPLLTDQNGHFSTILTLPHGSSILTITATDRFGRSKTERRTVFVP
jgi:hypothetical protein